MLGQVTASQISRKYHAYSLYVPRHYSPFIFIIDHYDAQPKAFHSRAEAALKNAAWP